MVVIVVVVVDTKTSFLLSSQAPEDVQALCDLRDCLFNPSSGLAKIDLMYNRIGESGALTLAPALGADNTKVRGVSNREYFSVVATLWVFNCGLSPSFPDSLD